MSNKSKPVVPLSASELGGIAETLLAQALAMQVCASIREAIRQARAKKLDITIEVVLREPKP